MAMALDLRLVRIRGDQDVGLCLPASPVVQESRTQDSGSVQLGLPRGTTVTASPLVFLEADLVWSPNGLAPG